MSFADCNVRANRLLLTVNVVGKGGGSGSSLEEDSECAKLRLELDKLKHESEMKCVALESQVRLCGGE